MLVKNWMSKNVITVDENDSMHDAMKHLKEHDIRMLPVMKKGKLVGIVTDRDLKRPRHQTPPLWKFMNFCIS